MTNTIWAQGCCDEGWGQITLTLTVFTRKGEKITLCPHCGADLQDNLYLFDRLSYLEILESVAGHLKRLKSTYPRWDWGQETYFGEPGDGRTLLSLYGPSVSFTGSLNGQELSVEGYVGGHPPPDWEPSLGGDRPPGFPTPVQAMKWNLSFIKSSAEHWSGIWNAIKDE